MRLFDIFYQYRDPYCSTLDRLGTYHVLADDEEHAKVKFRKIFDEEHFHIQCILELIDDEDDH